MSLHAGSRIAALLALAVLATSVAAASLGAQPRSGDLVPPAPSEGFVVDQTGLLDAQALARVNATALAVQQRSGGDVAVVLLRDLGDRAAGDVGVAIYRAWGVGHVDSIGSSRRDLGALLLIVPREVSPSGRGDCWITTGSGAEAELHDADAGSICRNVVIPLLREQRYEAAVIAGVDAIGELFDEVTAGASPLVGRSGGSPRGRGAGFVALLALGSAAGLGAGVVLVRSWRRRRPRSCPRGHGKMVRLSEAADDAELSPGQRVEERIGSVDYDVWACPVCPERLVLPYRRMSRYRGCPSCGFRTLSSTTRTLTPATTSSTGLERVDVKCRNCGFADSTRRVTPRLTQGTSSGSGSRSSGGGSRGGSSGFGGSGRTGGGGGGGRY